MSDFNEWFFEQLGDRDETNPPFKIARMWASSAYKAGATSRQAEIDELQKRIDDALSYVSESPLKDVSRRAMLNFLDILKGENND